MQAQSEADQRGMKRSTARARLRARLLKGRRCTIDECAFSLSRATFFGRIDRVGFLVETASALRTELRTGALIRKAES
jgi:hypothetical protein